MPRIAVLSDIHGNFPALQAVVADLKRRNVDLVLNLGDHVSGPLWPRETVEFLMQQSAWIQIAGNHERQLTRQDPAAHGASDRYAFSQLKPEQKQWLLKLPTTTQVEDEILLFHGTPSNDNVYLLETVAYGQIQLASPTELAQRLDGAQAHVMLCGHSHVPRVVRHQDGVLIVNPGSVGLQGYTGDWPEAHVVQVGSPEARYAILEKRAGNWQVEQFAIPYDHHLAAEQARQNGRQDWEVALKTGYIYP